MTRVDTNSLYLKSQTIVNRYSVGEVGSWAYLVNVYYRSEIDAKGSVNFFFSRVLSELWQVTKSPHPFSTCQME
jgi:hypothetical protein